jgi:hypothetical protein
MSAYLAFIGSAEAPCVVYFARGLLELAPENGTATPDARTAAVCPNARIMSIVCWLSHC